MFSNAPTMQRPGRPDAGALNPIATAALTGNVKRAGPPPRYTAAISKVYPYSLRPVVIITSCLGLGWGVALGVISLQDRGDQFEASKMKMFDLILAIFYFAVAGVEIFGAACAIRNTLSLAKLLRIVAPLGVLVALVGQIIAIVGHFICENDIINQCVQLNVGGEEFNPTTNTISSIDQTDAQSLCHSAWSRGTWVVIGWLLVTLFTSLFFASLAISYYRQVHDPSSIRPRQQAQSQDFQMRPPPPGQNWNQGQQPWMVPPYPGPPAGGVQFEKSDYHPNAEWAQNDPFANEEYAPPPGSPPRQGRAPAAESTEALVNNHEEEAWQRAQSTGVTAHLTGHAPGPRSNEQDDGYIIPNNEEDEAWERARNEGVTAHLTGQASGSASRRTPEGEV